MNNTITISVEAVAEQIQYMYEIYIEELGYGSQRSAALLAIKTLVGEDLFLEALKIAKEKKEASAQ